MRHPVLDALMRKKHETAAELDAHMLRLVPVGTRVGVMLREGQKIESIGVVVKSWDGRFVVRLEKSSLCVDVEISDLHVRKYK